MIGQGSPAIPEFQVQFILKISETFRGLVTLIEWTEHLFGAFETASKSQRRASLVKPGSEIRDLRGQKSVLTVFRISF